MPSYRLAVVRGLLEERPGLQRVEVESERGRERAYALTALTGPVAPGNRVVLNTTAVELGLGTGGWHVVHWNLDGGAWSTPGGGHVMKLRYTSLQADTGVAAEHQRPEPPSLDGAPVVACSLHSQVACVAVGFAAVAPGRRLAYVVTDGGALPLALSDLAVALAAQDLVAGTVTCGHAFGGDLEAVNLHEGLVLARRVLAADAVVVGPGPGVVGTGTPLGTTAVEVAVTVDAADALGGRSVVAVRWSDADARPRHQGMSHHTRTALDLARSAATVAVPAGAGPGRAPPGDAPGALPPDLEGHRVVVAPPVDVAGELAARHLEVTTMGRGPADDPGFFTWSAAAGAVAGVLAAGGGPDPPAGPEPGGGAR